VSRREEKFEPLPTWGRRIGHNMMHRRAVLIQRQVGLDGAWSGAISHNAQNVEVATNYKYALVEWRSVRSSIIEDI
jgi:hypothetical protein